MIYIQSKTGGRSENQDFYGTTQTPYGEIIVVCDGMGGHKGGRHAAELAVQTILQEMQNIQELSPEVALKNAIEKANTIIWGEGQSNPEYYKMGTTVVALLLTSEKAICAHMGDSRMYQLRDGEILHRTFDHSHVFELVKAGILTEEEARVSGQSNIITRALGISKNVDIELTDNLMYQLGDRFLLCTDGIWGVVPEKELVEMVSRKENIEKITNDLVDYIDKKGIESAGKHDNLTAALVEIDTEISIKYKQSTIEKRKPFFQNITSFIIEKFRRQK